MSQHPLSWTPPKVRRLMSAWERAREPSEVRHFGDRLCEVITAWEPSIRALEQGEYQRVMGEEEKRAA